jgi:ferredoxin-NADP reductase
MLTPRPELGLEVTASEEIADGVRQLTLAAPGGGPLPSFRPGSHLGLRWRPDRVNSYSLTGDGAAPPAYTVSVLRADGGRGGSAWAHGLAPGDRVRAVPPRSGFAPVATARRHLLVAGGIGVTPLLAHARWHARHGGDFALHYVHQPGRAPHLRELAALCGARLHAHEGRAALWDALGPALARQPLGTVLYACGPAAMIGAVTAAARALHWPPGRVRAEAFAAPGGPREPFGAVLADGRRIEVPAGLSLLEALERAGVAVPSMCRQGVCGECRTPLARGAADHRDLVLTPAERAAGRWIMPCVSRAAPAGGAPGGTGDLELAP